MMKNPVKVGALKGPNGEIRFGDELVPPGRYPVKEIVCHTGPHWDEVLAVFILREAGRRFFPGIETAVTVFSGWDELPNALTALKERGQLLVGCGDSPFNEHETETRGEVSNHCAATLVAELLGVGRKPELRLMLADALASDRNPQKDCGHISNLLKSMRSVGESDEEVFAWASKAAEALLIAQLDYWEGAAESFSQFARVVECRSSSGRVWQVAVVNADEEVYTKYAVSRRGLNVPIVVAVNSRQQVTILTNRRSDLPPWFIRELFRVLSVKHLAVMGKSVPNGYLLDRASLPDDVGGLHLWREGSGILNKGTPIGIPIEEVVLAVRDVIGRMRERDVRDGRRGKSNQSQLGGRPAVPRPPAPESCSIQGDGINFLNKVLDEALAKKGSENGETNPT